MNHICLIYVNSIMCGCDVIVIARYHENLRWTRSLNMTINVVTKDAGNIGREGLSYLHWIVENYKSLDPEKCTCFSQGLVNGFQMRRVKPTVFNTVFLKKNADVNGVHIKQANLHHSLCRANNYGSEQLQCFEILMHMIGKRVLKQYTTFASAYMIVRNRAIQRVPIFFYRRLIYGFLDPKIMSSSCTSSDFGFSMERFWVHLWSCKNCTYSFRQPRKSLCT